MALPKPVKTYLIGLILLLILSLVIAFFGIKQYSFSGYFMVSSCPYGGEIGPDGQLMNARHICPPDGGNTNWLLVSLFSAVIFIIYSIIYWIIYLFILLFRRIMK